MEEKKLHHANVIIGRSNCRDFVFDILKRNLNFKTEANPDFLIIEKESFGIDDARDLEKWSIGKPFLSELKVSLIVSQSITSEAQNALLKVLEEPTLGTYFFINLESLGGILPTFLSRVRILDLPKAHLDADNLARNFLTSKIKDKFALINKLAKKEGKNEMKNLIKDLEIVAYENRLKPADLKNILTAKMFVSSRGASPKMLLEWLSGVLSRSEF